MGPISGDRVAHSQSFATGICSEIRISMGSTYAQRNTVLVLIWRRNSMFRSSPKAKQTPHRSPSTAPARALHAPALVAAFHGGNAIKSPRRDPSISCANAMCVSDWVAKTERERPDSLTAAQASPFARHQQTHCDSLWPRYPLRHLRSTNISRFRADARSFPRPRRLRA